MPHIIIEHSKSIDARIVDEMLQEIPNLMEEVKDGNFSVSACISAAPVASLRASTNSSHTERKSSISKHSPSGSEIRRRRKTKS